VGLGEGGMGFKLEPIKSPTRYQQLAIVASLMCGPAPQLENTWWGKNILKGANIYLI